MEWAGEGRSTLNLGLQQQPSTTLRAYVIEAGIAVFLIPPATVFTHRHAGAVRASKGPAEVDGFTLKTEKLARKGGRGKQFNWLPVYVRHVGVEKWAGNLRCLSKGQINNISYVGANISVLDGRTEPADDALCRDTHCIAPTKEGTAILCSLKRQQPALFINSVQRSMPNALISRPAVAAFVCKSRPLPSCWRNTVHLLVFPAILKC